MNLSRQTFHFDTPPGLDHRTNWKLSLTKPEVYISNFNETEEFIEKLDEKKTKGKNLKHLII